MLLVLNIIVSLMKKISTVRSNGQFDPAIWKCLVQQVDCHFTVEPDLNGQVTLLNNFILFDPNIPNHGGPIHQPSL